MTLGQDANESGNRKPVVILGAGGHARVLISLLRLIDRPIHALLDDDPTKHSQAIDGLSITGAFDRLLQYPADEVELVNAIGSAHRPTARQAVYEQFTKLGYTFATLIHPAAIIAPQANVQPGAQVMASATIQAGAQIESNCLINTASVIDHDTTIGAHSHIASGATICGSVRVGKGCHIGAGATVIQGMTLGEGVVVAAGATVVNDVGDQQLVQGTPAKPRRP